MTTFYDVLGVSPDVTTGEIRTAYRERLKESHPDLNDDADANETTRRIVRARDVLTDEDERRRYDRVGHDEYVGNAADGVDEDDVGSAAAAARRAGWVNDGSDGDGTDGSGADGSGTGGDGADGDGRRRSARSGSRRRARDRRRRERAAAERVGSDDGDGRSDNGGTDDGRTDNGGTGDGAEDGTERGATASAAGRTATGGSASTGGTGWTDTGTAGYSVRQRRHRGRRRSRLIPTRRSLPLLVTSAVLYPLLVFCAVFPPFPTAVNLVVGVCVVFLVGYLQSQPEVGVVVFGLWSLLTPAAFVAAGVPLTGLVGIVALTGTWLPFGLSVLTFSLVRP